MKFLKLIRYQNLLLLACMQLLFRYAFLEQQNIPLALNHWQYGLLVLSSLLLAAAAYVIHAIFDSGTDLISKPHETNRDKAITETTAYNLYIGLNVSGVAIGFYLANAILKPSFACFFILIASLFYFYATSFRQIMILSNFIIALLVALSIIVIGVFDLFPVVNAENQAQMASLFSILTDYALFAFMLSFIREIVKDLEEVNTHYNKGINTLPIAIGIGRTIKIVIATAIIPFIFTLLYINTYFIQNGLLVSTLYSFAVVLAPLLYFIVKIFGAKSKQEFRHLSTVLNLILFFGLLSVLVITLNIKYNA
jgi:4-hydroxybenzoate polyprenyltransferase